MSATGNAGMDEELERLYRQLEDREARLRAVLDTAVDGIVTIDERGVIESVNPAAERMFGRTASELVGGNVTVLMPEPYRSEHDGYLRRYLETGEPRIIGIGREVEALRADGTRFPAELAVSQVDVGGRLLFTGILRDVSERKSAEEQAKHRLEELAHASRLSDMGEMTSGIAHEINQPLAAIVSFARACLRMLDADSAEPDVLYGALRQIAEQAERAGDIVHHLRELARKGETGREEVDLNAAIRGVLDLVSHELSAGNIRVRLDLTEDLAPVHANRIQIEQVILNLVRNAKDAMTECAPPGCTLHVGTQLDEEGRAEVAVIDTGVGLSDEVHERLFETFFTTKARGMGVGLAISRSIIEAHGGRLWAVRRADDGAEFRFQLPLPASEEQAR